MENPSYVAMSLMSGLHRQMDVMANNMANSSTPGYQGDKLAFRTLLSSRAGSPQIEGPGRRVAFVGENGMLRDTRPGPMESTRNPLDVAISGPGYFAVQTDDGVRYTRHGSFRPDSQGRLTMGNGAIVLGDGGAPITVPAGESKIEIDRRGAIAGITGPIGRLRIVKFEDEQAMRKTGDNLLETDADPQPVDQRTQVAQGMIESSNVQSVIEVTHMIDIMRRYQAVGRILEQEHERARKAIDKLSRVA